jgi:hypothetical protein
MDYAFYISRDITQRQIWHRKPCGAASHWATVDVGLCRAALGPARPTPPTLSVKEFFSDSAFKICDEQNALSWRRVKWFFGCVPPRHLAVGSDATTGGGAARHRLPEGTFFFAIPPKMGEFFWGFPKFRPRFSGTSRARTAAKLGRWVPPYVAYNISVFPPNCHGGYGWGGEIIFFGPPFPSSDSRNCQNNFF